MHQLAEIILWVSLLGLLHSYFFYPLILRILAIGKKPNALVFQPGEALPAVSVIMSLYNEEKVISQKLESLAALDYPTALLEVFIGSDCSSDATNELVRGFCDRRSNYHFFPFEQRRGKPIVVNDLVAKAQQKRTATADHVFLFTDASVMLEKNTLSNLVRHFRNPEIFLVDANMLSTGLQEEGISLSEHRYLSSEVYLKHLESLVWGKMIGPFGGCYALRSDHYAPVPAGYLVDDFYITMKAYEKGGKAINDLEAICFEGVSHDISEEYRRKSRISAGNFKNLATFRHLLWPPYQPLAFGFLSHKVLRWFGPFFIIFAFISCLILSFSGNNWYRLLFLLLTGWLFVVPVLEFILRKLRLNTFIFRSITYFNMMNLALLEGFFKYLKGVKSNVWQPPKRNG